MNKRIKRTKKDYGGGGGRTMFESGLFRVVFWRCVKGIYTELEVKLCDDLEIYFDGEQNLNTDKKCLEQLTMSEIVQIIDYQKKIAFEEGREDKAREIRKCLYMRNNFI